jgi:hypothetical protein
LEEAYDRVAQVYANKKRQGNIREIREIGGETPLSPVKVGILSGEPTRRLQIQGAACGE